MFYVIHWK